ncbi:MAG TPA: Xaa-Pro peptidase family protein [Vicinamibacteria bacterium]|nr:Xaa-Pro peptidase family protein [Vicinamibacteria bacterium]
MTGSSGPTIPESEFETRRSLVREAMARDGIDLFVAYSDDRAAFGQQHSRYLFNYQPHFEPALTLIPRDDEALIATGPESDAFVLATSWCRKVRVVDAFAHADEEYPHSTLSSLADLLTSLTRGGRVALAGLDALPQRAWKALRAASRAEIVDGEALIMKLRAVKSPAEIAVIRQAYRIAEAGIMAALRSIAPGTSEREVGAEAEFAMRRLGSEGMGIDTIVAAGADRTRAILARTTPAPIRAGDHVLLTLAPRYEGYHGAIGRVAAVGDVRPEIEAATLVAIQAQDAVAAALRAGAIGSHIDRIARDVCRAAGLEKYFAYSGVHSVGVVEFEPPILTSWYEGRLEAGMVFSVDIPVFGAAWGGLRIEDGFLVGTGAAEPLQAVSRELHRV